MRAALRSSLRTRWGLLDPGAPVRGGGQLLLLVRFVGQVHVVDGDVHLDHLQAGHPLDREDDVASHGRRELRDHHPVLDHQRDVDRGLLLADLGLDAARDAGPSAGHPVPHRAEGPGQT